MPKSEIPSVTVENAKIIYKNFEGKEGMYNAKGDRNFTLVLPVEEGEDLAKLGWNVKFKEPREEGDEPEAHLQVSVSYRNRPPRVVLITSRNRTPLTEDTIEVLDYADIELIDLVINPYEWVVGDKGGVKAYLKTMFVTVAEDDLERKYAINGSEE